MLRYRLQVDTVISWEKYSLYYHGNCINRERNVKRIVQSLFFIYFYNKYKHLKNENKRSFIQGDE